MTDDRKLGPNMKKLISMRMATLAIPAGGGIWDGVQAIMTGKLGEHFKEAMAWAFLSVDQVKAAPDNPYGLDDEKIAGALVEMVKARQEEQMKKLRK